MWLSNGSPVSSSPNWRIRCTTNDQSHDDKWNRIMLCAALNWMWFRFVRYFQQASGYSGEERGREGEGREGERREGERREREGERREERGREERGERERGERERGGGFHSCERLRLSDAAVWVDDCWAFSTLCDHLVAWAFSAEYRKSNTSEQTSTNKEEFGATFASKFEICSVPINSVCYMVKISSATFRYNLICLAAWR